MQTVAIDLATDRGIALGRLGFKIDERSEVDLAIDDEIGQVGQVLRQLSLSP